jgi:glycine/D-amino acid oxidase-like deaminating enzyme
VTCDQLILTGDGYLDDLAGGAARARVMPINNFILATEPLGERADQHHPLQRRRRRQPLRDQAISARAPTAG